MIYLPLIAIGAGLACAFVTVGVHSLFFVLLPIMAFIMGYFSSWRWGILNGFLLFLSCTLAMNLMWRGGDSNLVYPMPYIAAFAIGGFSLPVIGALAPMVRKGARSAGSIITLVILAIVVGWCAYSAVTHYGYYYQVAIRSAVDLKNLELYLPLGAISDDPYDDLYSQPYQDAPPGALTEDFTHELVDTEYGTMLKITIPNLQNNDVPQPSYTANIIFWQQRAPRQLVQLMPRQEVTPLDRESSRYFGPIKTGESRVVEGFEAPVKIIADKQAKIELTIWNRTDRGEAVSFAYIKSDTYTEQINQDFQTGSEWALAYVEATSIMEIRGMGD